MMKPKRVAIQWDPNKPTCPECDTALTTAMLDETRRYDLPGLPKGTINRYTCGGCGKAISVLLMDTALPAGGKPKLLH